MTEGFFLSTDMVDEQQRNDFWRETSSLIYDIAPCKDDGVRTLSGSVRSRMFGTLVVGNTTFNDQICRRTPAIIARTDLDLYLLQLILAGEYRGDFDGKDVHVRPGDMFLLDLTRVLNSKKEAGARLTLAIPRKAIRSSLSTRDLHGLVLRQHVSTNRLLADFMLSLDQTLDGMQPEEVPDAQESLMVLVNAALNGASLTPAQCAAINLTLRQRVLDYIDQHLADPTLSPATIMRRFRLSHSHLYRTFTPDKGVGRLIRNKRLDLAYRTIMGERDRTLPIKEVAYKCGFSDRAQFTRFFRDRFGLAPQDLKDVSNMLSHAPDSSASLHRYVSDRVLADTAPPDTRQWRA